jgi:peptide subunit release factor RF-3
LPYIAARWVEKKDVPTLEMREMKILDDVAGNVVTLFRSEWELRYFEETYPDIVLKSTSGL